jgi:hypothetical protein
MCTRVTSTKSQSFCMKSFSACLTNLTILLPQSWLQLLRKQMNTGTSAALNTETHWFICTLSTCDISLDLLKLNAREARDSVELTLLYLPAVFKSKKRVQVTYLVLVADKVWWQNKPIWSKCHRRIELSNVRLASIPLNITTIGVTASIDQGIVNSVRLNYRKLTVVFLLAHMASTSSNTYVLITQAFDHLASWNKNRMSPDAG